MLDIGGGLTEVHHSKQRAKRSGVRMRFIRALVQRHPFRSRRSPDCGSGVAPQTIAAVPGARRRLYAGRRGWDRRHAVGDQHERKFMTATPFNLALSVAEVRVAHVSWRQ